MKDKVQIIYENLQSIREALYGNENACMTIDQVAEDVANLAADPSKNGFTTAFVFSSENYPDKPSASTLNVSTGLVENLDQGWSQTDVSEDVSKMSFAVFDPAGENISGWATPINIKGAKGDRGSDGKPGATGAQGEKGENGLEGIVYRTVLAYTTTDTVDSPNRPIGGYWDRDTNEITGITSNDGNLWFTNSDEVSNKKYRWISEAIFDQSGYLDGEWSSPFRLTGEDGQDGVDGQSIEFIYRLLPSVEIYNDLREHLSQKPLYSSLETDRVPGKNDNLCETDWTDSPTGISTEYPVEVVCSRQWDTENKRWSDWSNCVIWSKWGEDGQDGDGVEYIYLVTTKTDNSGVIMTPEHVKLQMPDLNALTEHPLYQENEFCINGDFTVDGFNLDGYDWTDEPSDVGPSEPMEWVSIRKKIDGVWGPFSDPKLWAVFAEDGYSYITSYAFARSIGAPAFPTNGSYSNPNPDQDGVWFDSIPDGTDPVWMSMRTFCSKEGDAFDKGWSAPRMLSDTPDFQVEYSANETINKQFLKNLNEFASEVDPEAAWRADQAQLKPPYIWGDDDTIQDPTWMITATRTGGVWSDWVLTRIKGEKGAKGDSGSSVAIEGKFDTYDELLAAWNEYVRTGDVSGFYFESKDNVINQGDGWFVNEEGRLYIYSGGYTPGETNTNFDTYWTWVYLKGEPGDGAYLYFAYADNDPVANPNTQIRRGENATPGKYIGFKASTEELGSTVLDQASTYSWQKWKGEDGWGQEQIFILTDARFNPNGNHPPLPARESGDNTPEYLPYSFTGAKTTRWQDSPQDVSEDYPYCWVATRKVSESEYGDWKGVAGTNDAALYSRYSYDGVAGAFVHLTNDLAIIPLEDDIIDPDFKDEIYTYVEAAVGDEDVAYEDITVSTTVAGVKISGNKVSILPKQLNTNLTKIPLTVTLKGSSVNYTVTWNLMYTDVAYEIEPNTYSLHRYSNGPQAGKLDKTGLEVYVYKWNANKWVESNIPLYAKVVNINGSEYLLSQENGIIASNAYRWVDLSDCVDVSYIELFVVQSDANGKYDPYKNVKLSWERISVVSDGVNGGNFEVQLYPDQIVVPIDGNAVDSDWAESYTEEPLKTTLRAYKEGSMVSASQVSVNFLHGSDYEDFSIAVDEYGNFTGDIIVRNINALYGKTELPMQVTPLWNPEENRIVSWKFVNSSTAYQMNLSETQLWVNPDNGKFEGDSEIKATVRKFNGFVYNDRSVFKTVFATITFTNSSLSETITLNKDLVNGCYYYDFKNYSNVKSIVIFITEDDTKEGFVELQQPITIVRNGKDGSTGISMDYRGEFETHPKNPSKNWCYRNTKDGIVYIYNGTAWEPMIFDGTDGTDGISLFVTYHDNEIDDRPNKPTGDGTSNGWHHKSSLKVNWMSQKLGIDINDETHGGWGDPIQICGSDGESAINVSLSPDWWMIPTENGHVDKDCFDDVFESKLSVLLGTSNLPKERYEVIFDPAYENWGLTFDKDTGIISLEINEDNYILIDDEIEFSVSIDNGKTIIDKKIYIEFSDYPYRVSLDYDPIRLDSDECAKDPISGTVYKWDGKDYVPCSIKLKAVEREGQWSKETTSDVNGKFTIFIDKIFNDVKFTPDSFKLYGLVEIDSEWEQVFEEPISVVRGVLTSEETKELQDQIYEQVLNNFELGQDIIDKMQSDLYTALEEAIASGDLNAIKEIQLKIDELTDQYSAIEVLKGTVEDLQKNQEESVLEDWQLNALSEVSKLTQGDWEWDEESGELKASEVLAKSIVGLVGTFGTIDAARINGDVISGKTIQSSSNIGELEPGTVYEKYNSDGVYQDTVTAKKGDFGPSWQLRKNGAGYLANGNIQWNDEGKVTFGSKVSLGWGDELISIYLQGSNGYVDSSVEYLWTGKTELWDETRSYYVWAAREDYDDFMSEEYINGDGDNKDYNLVFTIIGEDIKVGDEAIVGGLVWYDYGNTDSWFPGSAGEVDYNPVIVNVKVGSKQTGLTEEDVEKVISKKVTKTYIDGLGITANKITANALTTDILSARAAEIGEIITPHLDVDLITVKQLDTIPEKTNSSGKITIKDNDLYVYKKGSDNSPVINVSGDTSSNSFIGYSDIPKSMSIEVTQEKVNPRITFETEIEDNELWMYGWTVEKIHSFTTNYISTIWQYSFQPSGTGIHGEINMSCQTEDDDNNTSVTISNLDAASHIVIAKSNTTVPFNQFYPEFQCHYENHDPYETNPNFYTQVGESGLYFYDGNKFTRIDHDLFYFSSYTTYDVYYYLGVDAKAHKDNDYSQWLTGDIHIYFPSYYSVNSTKYYYHFIKGFFKPMVSPFVGITPNGFQHLCGYNQYLSSESSKIIMRSGNWMFGIDMYGPFISNGTTTYSFDLSKMTERTGGQYTYKF